MNDTATQDEAIAGTQFTFPADLLPFAHKRIATANARLARNGIANRFTYTTTEYVRTQNGQTVQFIDLELSAPTIGYEGYTFLAVVERVDAELSDGSTEKSLVVRTAPGVDLDGWRPANMRCDHCGRTRSRAKTYLIADENGDRAQVGSSCLALYLGVKPSGLWVLGYDLDVEYNEDDYFGSGQQARERQVYDVREILSIALAVSDEGRGFVSRSAAYDGKPATADFVGRVLWEAPRETREDRAWRAEQWAAARQHLTTGTVDQVLTDIADMRGSSDYVTNLQTVADAEYTSVRNIALLVSAMRAYRVAREKAATPRVEYAPGFLSPVKAKVKGTTVTVDRVRHTMQQGYGYNAGMEEHTQLVMRDTDGHQIVWWATSKQDVNEGQKLTLTSGNVKKHGEYQGVDQTILTRVKYTTN